jgi:hypothetical protein
MTGELLQRALDTFTTDELLALIPLLTQWRHENSTVVGIVKADGTYVDLEHDWDTEERPT